MTSELLPGWNGTISRIGRSVGHRLSALDCAWAGCAQIANGGARGEQSGNKSKRNLGHDLSLPTCGILSYSIKNHATPHEPRQRGSQSLDLVGLANAFDQ